MTAMSYLDLARKVRMEFQATPTHPQPKPAWLTAWRELARLTNGVCADDPRRPAIFAKLDQCDEAYLSGSWDRFQEAAEQVRQIMGQTTA